MTHKLGHRDVVLLCILGAAVGADLLDRSGSWRVAGAVLILAAVSIAFASYMRRLQKGNHGADGRPKPEDRPTSPEHHFSSATRATVMSAYRSVAFLEEIKDVKVVIRAYRSDRVLAESCPGLVIRSLTLTRAFSQPPPEERKPGFEVHDSIENWERDWKVPNSKQVPIKTKRFSEDAALDLCRPWERLDQFSGLRKYQWRGYNTAVKVGA